MEGVGDLGAGRLCWGKRRCYRYNPALVASMAAELTFRTHTRRSPTPGDHQFHTLPIHKPTTAGLSVCLQGALRSSLQTHWLPTNPSLPLPLPHPNRPTSLQGTLRSALTQHAAREQELAAALAKVEEHQRQSEEQTANYQTTVARLTCTLEAHLVREIKLKAERDTLQVSGCG